MVCFLSFSWFYCKTPLQSEPSLFFISAVSILLNFKSSSSLEALWLFLAFCSSITKQVCQFPWKTLLEFIFYISFNYLKVMYLSGHLAGSLGGSCNSWSWCPQFKPHVGCRAYLKKKKRQQKLYIFFIHCKGKFSFKMLLL